MIPRFVPRLLAVAGAMVVVPLAAPSAAAEAQPGTGPLIQTSCSYEQLYAAISVEAPDLATDIDQRPGVQQKLRSLAGMSVEQRQQELNSVLDRNPGWREKLNAKWNTPEGQEKVALAARVADTCHNY